MWICVGFNLTQLPKPYISGFTPDLGHTQSTRRFSYVLPVVLIPTLIGYRLLYPASFRSCKKWVGSNRYSSFTSSSRFAPGAATSPSWAGLTVGWYVFQPSFGLSTLVISPSAHFTSATGPAKKVSG